MKNKTIAGRIFSHIKTTFLSGLFLILPIAATIFFLMFAFSLLGRWLAPLRDLEPEFLRSIPGSEFFTALIGIFVIGALLRMFVLNPIIHYFERIIAKIPFINSIYSGAKTLVDFFNISTQEEQEERKVVLIKFPNNTYYNLAFLLGPATNSFQPLFQKDDATAHETYFKIFMPNSPNPSTGYFFIVPESHIINTTITFEEAIKTIVSCGLITPESLIRPPQ